MKKIGTLNSGLSRIIASLGHTDQLVVCDSGLPIPRGKDVVDLALTANIPSFVDTVRVVLQELYVEQAIIAEEMEESNGKRFRDLLELLGSTPIHRVSHEEFKQLSRRSETVAFVRTGEATPFANVILGSGVTFS